jgi:serine/threonine protein kinase
VKQPTRKLGPYTLIRKIGRGAFGVVWLAEKKSSIASTRFALKLPRDEDIDLEAFTQEATIWLEASGHPNVVPLIDADIYDEQVVIVSEYVPDGSLATWLKHNGGRAPSVEAACEIVDGVLAGLRHLHERQIIHRDLKPENILLQRETPRLTDFGIARLLKTNSYSTNISGTFAYMAPEAFDGKRNQQTDLWSAGVIFYQMLAGRLPYDQSDTVSLIAAIVRNDPPRLPESVPAVVSQIVMKALQRDPINRYATVTEMRRDLREAEHRLWLGGQKEPAAQTEAESQRPTELRAAPITELNPEPMPHRPLLPTVPAIAPAETGRSIAAPTLRFENINVPKKIRARRSLLPFLWSVGVAAVCVLFLGVLSLGGVYYWSSFRRASKEPGTVTKQTHGPYALTRTLMLTDDHILSVSFSPDGKTLASGSGFGENTVKLWDTQTWTLKKTLTGHTEFIHSVVFSPDGKTVASGSGDKTIKLWDTQTGSLKQTLTGTEHPNGVISPAFSPDGKTLASDDDDKVRLWDAQTGALRQTLSGHTDSVFSIAFSPDGITVASGSADNTIKLWDGQKGILKQTLTGHTGPVRALAFSPDGKTLASGSYDRTVKLWDVQRAAVKQTLTGHADAVNSAAFSSDGSTLVSGSDDKTIKLWDVQTGVLKQTLIEHSGQVTSVAFSSDGKTLASGSYDKTIKLWQSQ